MVLSLLALGAEVTPEVRKAEEAIENAFLQMLDETHPFKNFTSEKTFLAELSTAVETDSIIVAAAEPAYYRAFKTFVCNAFQLKTKPSKLISGEVGLAHPELEMDFVISQSEIPAAAVPLLSQDGLYSGFGVKAKKQILIVLPLDDTRINFIIGNSLIEYVRRNADPSLLSPATEEDDEPRLAERRERVPGQLYDAELIRDVVRRLEEDEFTIALADTKTVDFVGTISTTAVDLSNVVFLTDYTVQKGDMSAREYAVNLAKGALDNSSNDLGATLTKVFALPDENGNKEYFMYVCIADESNANVAKLIADPDETPPQLIYRAVEELFRMISLWIDTGYALPQTGNYAVVRKSDRKLANPVLKKFKIAFGVALGASAAASLLVSFLANNVYGVL